MTHIAGQWRNGLSCIFLAIASSSISCGSARDQGLFRISVAGGREERVMNMSDWHLTGRFGASMSLDPNGAPLLLRDVGSDDIYALTLEH